MEYEQRETKNKQYAMHNEVQLKTQLTAAAASRLTALDTPLRFSESYWRQQDHQGACQGDSLWPSLSEVESISVR